MPVDSMKYAATMAQSIAVSLMSLLRRSQQRCTERQHAVYLVASSAHIGEGMTRYTRRSAVASLAFVLACVGGMPSAHARQGAGHVKPGITVLLADSASLINGKRVGLLTNQSASSTV